MAASTLGPCGPRLSPPHLIEVATTPPNELMSRLPPITRATVRDFLTYLREEIALNELSVQGVDRLSGAVALHKWTLEADEILNTKRSPEKIAEDEFGELYRSELPGDEPLVMVKVINSTPEPDGSSKPYFLRVHPEARLLLKDGFGDSQKLTPLNAVASTFGLTGAEYLKRLVTQC